MIISNAIGVFGSIKSFSATPILLRSTVWFHVLGHFLSLSTSPFHPLSPLTTPTPSPLFSLSTVVSASSFLCWPFIRIAKSPIWKIRGFSLSFPIECHFVGEFDQIPSDKFWGKGTRGGCCIFNWGSDWRWGGVN